MVFAFFKRLGNSTEGKRDPNPDWSALRGIIDFLATREIAPCLLGFRTFGSLPFALIPMLL
jgi:hypothetical protein